MKWQTLETTIVCATDGGLKQQVGTSSYAFFLPGISDLVLEGFSAEYQPHISASSTRQELLGQLGAEYWLSRWQKEWGTPVRPLRFVLVTDSQASIEIMKSIPSIVGISGILKPEMDVALALFDSKAVKEWVVRKIVKVTSHIDRDEAPDQYLWDCNEKADALATEARAHFSTADILKRKPLLLPGVRAACIIDGGVENNNLYQKLSEKLNGETMNFYLCQKYAWTPNTITNIAWLAYKRELDKYPKPNRATLIKFLHGWMATKKRRHLSGTFTDPNCPLCGETETNAHIYQCSHAQFASLRRARWMVSKEEICQHTPDGIQQVFLDGIHNAFKADTEEQTTILGWPEDLQTAYTKQVEIGWQQVFYGRIAQTWEHLLSTYGRSDNDPHQYFWTGRMIRIFWKYGLDLWTTRNTFIHGPPGEISRMAVHRTRLMVQELYQQLLPQMQDWELVLFALTEKENLAQPYHSQNAWLESIRMLFPEKYKQIEMDAVGKLQSIGELETIQLNGK